MLEISEQEVLDRLAFDNPWWEAGGGTEERYSRLPRRFYFQPFLSLVNDRTTNRAVVLMGPRRVGKTVMVFHGIQALLEAGVAGQSIFYLSIETPLYTGLPLEKLLNLFRQRFAHGKGEPLYVFFDEVQYLRDWEIHLKSLVDSYPSCRFVVTGSAAAALKLKSQESGAGRFTDFILPPLTFAEYLNFIGKDRELLDLDEESKLAGPLYFFAKDIDALNREFCNYLNFGGYPEAVMSPTIQADPGRYIKSDIIDKVLLRDLPSLYGISDIQELNRLFTTLAYNTGHEITMEGLSRSAGVAKNTIRRYLEYLEAAFLIRRVHRIDHNARYFQRAASFKVYLTNPSMRAALFGQVDADATAMGHLVETAVYAQWLHSRVVDNLCYARWKGGEVDIVHLDEATQKPDWMVEVKWSDRVVTVRDELRNCIEFSRRNVLHPGGILVTTRTLADHQTHDGVHFEFVPSACYAYTLGTNILKYRMFRQSAD